MLTAYRVRCSNGNYGYYQSSLLTMMMVCCARVCMCVCVGGGAWARARARAWAARFGLALGPLARARAEVARANTRCSQDTSPLVLHAFGLHSATLRSPRSPLRARVRGSCSGLGLGTRGSRSGSYSYSGLATARLGDAIATIQWPCVLSVFSSLRWAIGGLVLYALHAVGPRVGRADAVDGL